MLPKLPTFRSSLLRLHHAIIKIDQSLSWVDRTPRLNKLEKFVILLEDKRFLQHFGFDMKSAFREIWRFLKRERNGGASTIEMQLFRTTSDRYERTIRRKLREIVATIVMHRKFTKIEILRAYLQIAYMGTGLKGVNAAARECFPHHFKNNDEIYFGFEIVDFNEFSDEECAFLASMLVYPKPRVPTVNWNSKIARRSNYGLALYSRRHKSLDQILR